jgi:hypothetical protein
LKNGKNQTNKPKGKKEPSLLAQGYEERERNEKKTATSCHDVPSMPAWMCQGQKLNDFFVYAEKKERKRKENVKQIEPKRLFFPQNAKSSKSAQYSNRLPRWKEGC